MNSDQTLFRTEIVPRVPPELRALETFANDLRYSWERDIRALFVSLDPQLWEACGHSPKIFLRRVSRRVLDDAVENRSYMARYSRVKAYAENYDNLDMRESLEAYLDRDRDLIAYFCAEFGLHESMPIYSGGLGILAGDHCKSASDLGIPFVAVGLLYRQGYFTQQIDRNGVQHATYRTSNLDNLPVSRALDDAGNPLRIHIELPHTTLHLQVWLAKIGHIKLVLLDADLPENAEAERNITFRLYGGDRDMRIRQEIVLGIGGVRALRALGLSPNVWHINEGHAAFLALERCREYVAAGMDFHQAWELTAGATLFTTHTPVPAGHDIFASDLVMHYLGHWPELLGVSREQFLNLGRTHVELHGFNMTSLALHASRYHNGVSRIHGGVASRTEAAAWPEIEPEENPIDYITNGVHASTFLAMEWQNLFDTRFPDWRNELTNAAYWDEIIAKIPDHRFWSVRRECKSAMLAYVRQRLISQLQRNAYGDNEIRRITGWLDEKGEHALVVGFARRFATYKRAYLLFHDVERLDRLLSNEDRPILFIFAGKAHPADQPGQELLAHIHRQAMNPRWAGKILLVEDYDLALSRKLVAGVDVWLNTPEYPLEASGTSGQKAGMNGVLNLSITDGWWAEGYNGKNGWAIYPHNPSLPPHERDNFEAEALYELLEDEIIPLFYERDHLGYSRRWVAMAKASMSSIIPRFSAERMLTDYIRKFYSPAARNHDRLSAAGAKLAAELGRWKQIVRDNWPSVTVELLELPPEYLCDDEALRIDVKVTLGGLRPEDVAVECLFGTCTGTGQFVVDHARALHVKERHHDHAIFGIAIPGTDIPGERTYRLRVYPRHEGLTHPFELGLMRYAIWPARV